MFSGFELYPRWVPLNLWRWFTLTSPLISVGPTESPFHLTKLLSPVPLQVCILLAAGTISKHAVPCNGSVKPEWTVPLGTWNFRNFKPKFLLNGKRPGTEEHWGVFFKSSIPGPFSAPRFLAEKYWGRGCSTHECLGVGVKITLNRE